MQGIAILGPCEPLIDPRPSGDAALCPSRAGDDRRGPARRLRRHDDVVEFDTVAWNGGESFNRTSPIVDANGTADGSLLIWGLPWDGDAAGFVALIDDVGGRFNGCNLAGDPMPVEIDGVAGLSFRHICATYVHATAIALVKDGYGLTFRMVADNASVHDPAVLERLKEWMAGATCPTTN